MKKKKPVISSDSPVMGFISSTSLEEPEPEPEPLPELGQQRAEDIPDGYKLNPLYIEKKSRRVQLVLKQSLYDKVKFEADLHGKSFNEYVHSILEKYVGE